MMILRLTHLVLAMSQAQVLRKGRKLSDFSPQQLAAIAWSFATVGIEAPRLFEAVQVNMLSACHPSMSVLLGSSAAVAIMCEDHDSTKKSVRPVVPKKCVRFCSFDLVWILLCVCAEQSCPSLHHLCHECSFASAGRGSATAAARRYARTSRAAQKSEHGRRRRSWGIRSIWRWIAVNTTWWWLCVRTGWAVGPGRGPSTAPRRGPGR